MRISLSSNVKLQTSKNERNITWSHPRRTAMGDFNLQTPVTRRRAITLAGLVAGSVAMTRAGVGFAGSNHNNNAAQSSSSNSSSEAAFSGSMQNSVISQIESILQTQGTISNGVLTIEQDRTDLQVTGPMGVPFLPSFALSNSFAFQSLSYGRAIMNGNFTLTAEETNPVIDAIIGNNLVLQAFHQHYIEENPQVWHIHLRGISDPISLAQSLANVVAVTATPLPQSPPPNPITSLPSDQLGQILGGDVQIQSDGVVLVSLPRAETIKLGGVVINPHLNVDTHINFEPLSNGQAAASADFGMIASEINNVVQAMRSQSFFVGCLYNQETAEYPQLYWAHMLNTGDPVTLANQIRKGLDQMNLQFKS